MSCAVYWKDFTVFLIFVGDTKERFQLVFAFLQCGGHDEYDVFVDPKLPTGDGSKGW
jgi:hypothetical protein